MHRGKARTSVHARAGAPREGSAGPQTSKREACPFPSQIGVMTSIEVVTSGQSERAISEPALLIDGSYMFMALIIRRGQG